MVLINGIESYDNHMLSVFESCPVKYFYSIELGLQPTATTDPDGSPDGSRVALDFGIAFHKGVELWRTTGDRKLSILEASSLFSPREPRNETKRTLAKLTELLSLYFDYYENDGYRLYSGWAERTFALPLREDIIYCGRMDSVLCQKSSPNVRTLSDIKTSSAVDKFSPQPHSQFTGYLWGGRQMISGLTGLLVDLVGVYKGKPMRGKNGDWLSGKTPADVFFRYTITREPEEIKEWETETIQKVETIRELRKTNKWWKVSNSCMSWGRACPYKPICLTKPGNRNAIINSSMYEVDKWNPMKDEN